MFKPSVVFITKPGRLFIWHKQKPYPDAQFFVDDLKLYASSISILKKQLDLVTTFSNDIGMKFDQDKCTYIQIEKGKNTTTTPVEINGLTIKSFQEGESY